MALVGTLLDHKWLIGGISIAFMALGAAYSVLTPPIYQATALVQVEPKKGDMLGFSDVGSLLGKESPTVTEIELIRSRITIGTAVDNLNLDLDVNPSVSHCWGALLPVVSNPPNRRQWLHRGWG